jgi:hypothetical protein
MKSPATGQLLAFDDLIPNKSIRKLIAHFLKRRPELRRHKFIQPLTIPVKALHSVVATKAAVTEPKENADTSSAKEGDDEAADDSKPIRYTPLLTRSLLTCLLLTHTLLTRSLLTHTLLTCLLLTHTPYTLTTLPPSSHTLLTCPHSTHTLPTYHTNTKRTAARLPS